MLSSSMLCRMVLVCLLKFRIAQGLMIFKTDSSSNSYTLLKKDHGYLAGGQSSLSFRVKACEQVIVGFSLGGERDFQQDEMTYVLFAEESFQIVVNNIASPTKYRKILNCDVSKAFMIEWNVTGITTFNWQRQEWAVLGELYMDSVTPSLSNFTDIGVLSHSDAEWRINTDGQESITPSDTLDTNSASTASPECHCVCYNATSFSTSNCTSTDVNCLVRELRVELTVDKSALSSSIRKKVSIGDNRPTAQALGAVGAIIIVVSVSSIIVPDVLKLVRYLYQGKDVKNLTKKQRSKRRISIME